jgi:hypothetical protein
MKSHTAGFSYSTRRSKWVYRTQEFDTERDYSASLYPHMLIEDIHLALLPNPRYYTNAKTVIRLEPPNDAAEAMILQGVGRIDRDPRDLVEAVSKFVDDTAQMISYYGECYYEIVYFGSEPSVFQSFTIELIPNWTFSKGLRSYTQRQPQEGNDRKEPKGIRRVGIPRESIVHFRVPGGPFAPRRHRRLMRRLSRLSSLDAPARLMAPDQPQSGFDFTQYNHSNLIKLARSTKDLGWHARQSYQAETTEFYLVYRHLRFELWRAKLREAIVSSLNEALTRAGAKIGFQARIVVEGIPTSDEIAHIIDDVRNGQLEFSSALEKSKTH